jgi:hypothetical protein
VLCGGDAEQVAVADQRPSVGPQARGVVVCADDHHIGLGQQVAGHGAGNGQISRVHGGARPQVGANKARQRFHLGATFKMEWKVAGEVVWGHGVGVDQQHVAHPEPGQAMRQYGAHTRRADHRDTAVLELVEHGGA